MNICICIVSCFFNVFILLYLVLCVLHLCVINDDEENRTFDVSSYIWQCESNKKKFFHHKVPHETFYVQ